MTEVNEAVHEAPSAWRAWWFLVWLSMARQLRGQLMVGISLGLLAFSILIVFVNTQAGRWSMAHYHHPKRTGPTYDALLRNVERVQHLPWDPAATAVSLAATGSMRVMMTRSSGFFIFSNSVVFALFTTFLLPLWSLSFATEGLGRERESGNLIWLLTRPLSRPAIYLAKLVALLPWSLALNLGGFALLCLAGGSHGRLALATYWPAVFWGTLAFCSLFHLMGAWMRRPAVVAILYAFFFETFFGNLPGQMKRLSISYYVRCLMFERSQEMGIQPQRPEIFVPVSSTFALVMLLTAGIACVVVGMIVFSRSEYIEDT